MGDSIENEEGRRGCEDGEDKFLKAVSFQISVMQK